MAFVTYSVKRHYYSIEIIRIQLYSTKCNITITVIMSLETNVFCLPFFLQQNSNQCSHNFLWLCCIAVCTLYMHLMLNVTIKNFNFEIRYTHRLSLVLIFHYTIVIGKPVLYIWQYIRLLHCHQGNVDSLQWRHNECNSFSNAIHIDCLFNRLFRRRS